MVVEKPACCKRLVGLCCAIMTIFMANMDSTLCCLTYGFDNYDNNNVTFDAVGRYKNFSQYDDDDENGGRSRNWISIIWFILCLKCLLHHLLLWIFPRGGHNKWNGFLCHISFLKQWSNYTGYEKIDGLYCPCRWCYQQYYIGVKDLFHFWPYIIPPR